MSAMTSPWIPESAYRVATEVEAQHLRRALGKLIAAMANKGKQDYTYELCMSDPSATEEEQKKAKTKFQLAEMAQDSLVDDFAKDRLVILYEEGCVQSQDDSLMNKAHKAALEINDEYEEYARNKTGEPYINFIRQYRRDNVDKWKPVVLKARSAEEADVQSRWRGMAKIQQQSAKEHLDEIRKKQQTKRDNRASKILSNDLSAAAERRARETPPQSAFSPDSPTFAEFPKPPSASSA